MAAIPSAGGEGRARLAWRASASSGARARESPLAGGGEPLVAKVRRLSDGFHECLRQNNERGAHAALDDLLDEARRQSAAAPEELAEAVVFCECPGQQANEEHNRGLGLRLQQMAQDGALAVAEAGWPPSLPLSAEVRRRAADIIAAIVGASARHAEQQALAEQQAALQAAGVF